ncbi:cytochrome c3 family protein [Acidobacteriota bacterium]
MRNSRHLISLSILLFLFFVFSPRIFSMSTDEDCMLCHEDSELKTENGESLFVESKAFLSSIHGEAGISCVECHSDLMEVEDFPHAENLVSVDCSVCHDEAQESFQKSIHSQATAGRDCCTVGCADCHGKHDIKTKDDFDSRVFPLNLPKTCERCHLERVKTERGSEFIKQYEKSIHYEGLEKAGLTTSSNCSNCHGAHDIKSVHDPLSRVAKKNVIQTCGECHVGIERDYLEGVHGQDYLEGSLDIPVCTDCHSEHDISSHKDLSSSVYTTNVAEVCSRCHDDEALALQYGFLTSRLKTFSDSFHGTASRFGEASVANCASCHGFHGIRPSSDPKSTIHPDNLPETCGKCHPGAGVHFAEGKIHVISEKTSNKGAYIVKTAYIVIIAVIVFIFLLFIAVDLLHRLAEKGKK